MICPGLGISIIRGLEEYSSGDFTIFGPGDTTNTKLVFSELPCLKRIVIGRYCFQNVREFLIDNDCMLTEVIIGEYCFMQEEKGGTDGICQISNCEALCEIRIGRCSFQDYDRFELKSRTVQIIASFIIRIVWIGTSSIWGTLVGVFP